MPAFALLFFLTLLVLSPLLFGGLMLASLEKLHLGPSVALTLVVAMFLGGLVNIPIVRLRRERQVQNNPLAVYGLADFWPQFARHAQQTIIAVNLGGCIIPVALCAYEITYLATLAPRALALGMFGCLVNIGICYSVAQPVKGIGIAMPAFLSPFAAAVLALLLVPEAAPPVAFVIGVTGPLIGADLLHLKEIEATDAGVASIGGAGTFDGIVLSGIIAAYLA
ncbi:DUF1614 domain-containing protein [Bradyrhizobium sp.]|uniref:DUF1614 domain-containing protein n=1 Tax=Bradyrhizobium sp. TaxID=376 RepID=UPI0023A58906|nr:DUF1614 domain-containing protein [Bradyrhizobium sp.]MDE1932548.1 DUF1614 domain-containing protein [Bradyrhizobium sp.]MDE2061115.1 DUF1614 domain-containing protein [Bradyrhizobium sp.]